MKLEIVAGLKQFPSICHLSLLVKLLQLALPPVLSDANQLTNKRLKSADTRFGLSASQNHKFKTNKRHDYVQMKDKEETYLKLFCNKCGPSLFLKVSVWSGNHCAITAQSCMESHTCKFPGLPLRFHLMNTLFLFFSKLSVAWLHQPSRMVLNSLNIYMFYSWRLRIDCSPLTFGFKKSRPVVAFTFSNPGTVNIVSMIQNGRQGSPVCHPIRTYSGHVSRLFLVLLISIWVCLKIGYIHVYSQL